jgi:hypothetical protein
MSFGLARVGDLAEQIRGYLAEKKMLPKLLKMVVFQSAPTAYRANPVVVFM